MAERGTIGKATFDRVQELVGAGASKSDAFAKVADESGRTAATVATAFYRVARSLPDGGGVKQRPRKKTATAAAPAPARRPREATPSIDAIVADLHRGVDALAARLRAAEGELAARRDESARIDQIRKMLGS
jgi:hypothetical protein